MNFSKQLLDEVWQYIVIGQWRAVTIWTISSFYKEIKLSKSSAEKGRDYTIQVASLGFFVCFFSVICLKSNFVQSVVDVLTLMKNKR